MTLDFLVILKRQKIYQGLQEARLYDGRFVLRVYGYIADACSRRQYQGEIRGLQKAKQGLEAICFDYLQLVFLCKKVRVQLLLLKFQIRELTIASEIPQCQRRLALNLQTRAVHECDKTGDKFGLALRKFLSVGTCD
jgi:hypothetical protein